MQNGFTPADMLTAFGRTRDPVKRVEHLQAEVRHAFRAEADRVLAWAGQDIARLEDAFRRFFRGETLVDDGTWTPPKPLDLASFDAMLAKIWPRRER